MQIPSIKKSKIENVSIYLLFIKFRWSYKLIKSFGKINFILNFTITFMALQNFSNQKKSLKKKSFNKYFYKKTS